MLQHIQILVEFFVQSSKKTVLPKAFIFALVQGFKIGDEPFAFGNNYIFLI